MHHSLSFYGRYQRQFLRLYMSLAKLTRVPVLGGWVRGVANVYGRRGHNGYLLTLAEAEEIVDASGELALGPCTCRQVYHSCDAPVMGEILIGDGVEALLRSKAGGLRRVTREEAKEVLRLCHAKRLTHAIVRCRERYYAICNCCSCCCVPTRLRREYGIEYALVRDKSVVEAYRTQKL